jgi:hypothetical protein
VGQCASGQAGRWPSGLAGQKPGRPVGQQAGRPKVGSDGEGVADRLFFQCSIIWRSLPWAGVQVAKVSALPVAVPQPSMSPVSQQGL